jgi:hypothetical protein
MILIDQSWITCLEFWRLAQLDALVVKQVTEQTREELCSYCAIKWQTHEANILQSI